MSLVRPIVEYASTIWDPHTKTNIKKTERVQRRAARFVLNNYNYDQTNSVTAMVQRLAWETLQQRRARAKAIMLHRIIHGLVDIIPHQYLTPNPRSEHKFIQPPVRIDIYKYSFFPSSIKIWNQLPDDTRPLPTIEVFKTAINSINCIPRYH
jgi:hypothetical protein